MGTLSQTDLLTLSDPDTVTTPQDFQSRLERITKALAERNDNAGLFPTAYLAVTRRSIKAIDSGRINDRKLANSLTIDFGKRFLKPLHAHLKEENPGPIWESYYAVAETAQKPNERVLGMGFNAHLTLDLAESLAAVHASSAFRDDYMRMGEALLEGVPDIVSLVQTNYQFSCGNFLNGFALGRGLDCVLGKGTTTRLAFQTIRQEAWTNSQLLQKPERSAATRRGMRAAFGVREGLLATLSRESCAIKRR